MESGGGNGSNRRRPSLDERRDSANNLRDLLRVKDNDDNNDRLTGLTLSAVLSSERRPLNRTLLDIIRDDPNINKEDKKSWKFFKDKLRLRRTGAAWTSTIHVPTSDVPMQQNNNNSRMMTRRHSTRFQNASDPNSNESNHESTQPEATQNMTLRRNSTRRYPNMNASELDESTHELTQLELSAQGGLSSVPSNNRAMLLRRNSSFIPERQISRLNYTNENTVDENDRYLVAEEGVGEAEEEEEMTIEEEGPGEGAPVRMSLMALLAETDRQMGLDGTAYMMDDDEEEEEEEVVESGGGGGGEYNNCCVCMVRHKGAAFIPCGHTFCRLCSRELWVQRGNCPLCNGFILEILDIF